MLENIDPTAVRDSKVTFGRFQLGTDTVLYAEDQRGRTVLHGHGTNLALDVFSRHDCDAAGDPSTGSPFIDGTCWVIPRNTSPSSTLSQPTTQPACFGC